jgi:hypothetical protein
MNQNIFYPSNRSKLKEIVINNYALKLRVTEILKPNIARIKSLFFQVQSCMQLQSAKHVKNAIGNFPSAPESLSRGRLVGDQTLAARPLFSSPTHRRPRESLDPSVWPTVRVDSEDPHCSALAGALKARAATLGGVAMLPGRQVALAGAGRSSWR